MAYALQVATFREYAVKREQIINVLYDMALVIGGESHVKPLIHKTLQRLLSNVRAFTGQRRQYDDLTAFVVRAR